MPTISQLVRKNRRSKKRKSKSPALQGCPQKAGTVLQIKVIHPKKPNSANRVVVRVRLSNGMVVSAYVPGERNNLAEHHGVLIQGGRVKDLPGVRYHVVRGVRDASPGDGPTSTSKTVEVRRNQSRSRYGVKKAKKV